MQFPNNDMAYFIEMRYVMGFPNLFIAEMDRVGVLQGPFPTHDWKFSVETDGIHHVGTKIEWRKVLWRGGSLLSIFSDDGG